MLYILSWNCGSNVSTDFTFFILSGNSDNPYNLINGSWMKVRLQVKSEDWSWLRNLCCCLKLLRESSWSSKWKLPLCYFHFADALHSIRHEHHFHTSPIKTRVYLCSYMAIMSEIFIMKSTWGEIQFLMMVWKALILYKS